MKKTKHYLSWCIKEMPDFPVLAGYRVGFKGQFEVRMFADGWQVVYLSVDYCKKETLGSFSSIYDAMQACEKYYEKGRA